MYVITNEELLNQVAGGDDDDAAEYSDGHTKNELTPQGTGGGDSPNNGGDQRNQSQRDADARLQQAQNACSALGNLMGCSSLAAAENYRIQAENYAICKATGGQDGPSDCGRAPKLPK